MAKGRTNKYYTHVKPRFPEIAKWYRGGASDEAVAEALSVSYSRFRDYVRMYPELKEIMKSKDHANALFENALLEKAHGFERIIEEPMKLRRESYDERGKKVIEEYIETVERVVYFPPETAAIKFWLTNKDRPHWSDRTEVEQVDKEVHVNISIPREES